MSLENNSTSEENDKAGSVRLGSRERRLLSEAAQIESELVPAFVRPGLYIVAGMIILFLLWAAMTHLTELARGTGEILPTGDNRFVQHLDGGVVSKIFVEERQLVQKGEPLVAIDGTQAIADLRQMQAREIALRLRAERLMAFADNRPPKFKSIGAGHLDLLADQEQIFRNQMNSRNSTLSILDSQINQLNDRVHQLGMALDIAHQQQNLTGELLKMREDLASRNLINRTVLLETRRAKLTSDGEVDRLNDEVKVVSQQLAEIRNRRLDTENQLRQSALTEFGTANAELAEVVETIPRLQAKVDRLIVRAPHRGHVLDLKVNTVGQVVQPGALLMEVVPDDEPLEAEVHISMSDIGFVKVGQPVNIRVTSFDYARLGLAKGILKKLTISSVADSDGKPYYRGWITVTQPYVGNVPGQYPLQPGMAIEGDIITGQKTLLAYLTKPLIDAITYSFKER
jgi:adhesin transport system membrane fusion protein